MITLEGIYKAVVMATWVNEPEGGSAYVNIKSTVSDGGSDEVQFIRIYISDKAMPFARKQLSRIGFDVDTQSIYALSNGSTLLEGREFEAAAVNETYKGETRLKWKISVEDAPVSEEKAKRLDDKLRAAKKKDGDDKPKAEKKSDAEKLKEIQAAAPKHTEPSKPDTANPLF